MYMYPKTNANKQINITLYTCIVKSIISYFPPYSGKNTSTLNSYKYLTANNHSAWKHCIHLVSYQSVYMHGYKRKKK